MLVVSNWLFDTCNCYVQHHLNNNMRSCDLLKDVLISSKFETVCTIYDFESLFEDSTEKEAIFELYTAVSGHYNRSIEGVDSTKATRALNEVFASIGTIKPQAVNVPLLDVCDNLEKLLMKTNEDQLRLLDLSLDQGRISSGC